jgi:hypothetical protein
MSRVVVVRQKEHGDDKKKKKKKKSKKTKKELSSFVPNAADDYQRGMEALAVTRDMNERLMSTEAHNVELWIQWANSQEKLLGKESGEALRFRRQAILEQAIVKNPSESRLYLELLRIEGFDRVTLFDMWLKVVVKFNTDKIVIAEFVRFL